MPSRHSPSADTQFRSAQAGVVSIQNARQSPEKPLCGQSVGRLCWVGVVLVGWDLEFEVEAPEPPLPSALNSAALGAGRRLNSAGTSQDPTAFLRQARLGRRLLNSISS